MSWLITAVVATGALTAYSQKEAAEAQEDELERQAEEERIAAEGRELQRRQQLNKVLSANVVELAAGGVSTEGTPSSIALESAKQASVSEGITKLSDKLKQAQLRRQAQNVSRAGTFQAASTLLSSGTKAAQINTGND